MDLFLLDLHAQLSLSPDHPLRPLQLQARQSPEPVYFLYPTIPETPVPVGYHADYVLLWLLRGSRFSLFVVAVRCLLAIWTETETGFGRLGRRDGVPGGECVGLIGLMVEVGVVAAVDVDDDAKLCLRTEM